MAKAVEHEAAAPEASFEHHYTLYYYDQAGDLAATVAPGDVRLVPEASAVTDAGGVYRGPEPAHARATTYRYNSLAQVTESQSPDAGRVQTWYDYAQRPRLTQDAAQAVGDGNGRTEHLYTRYDGLGRVTDRGEVWDVTDVSPHALAQASFPVSYQTVTGSTFTAKRIDDRTITTYTTPLPGGGNYDHGAHARGRVVEVRHHSSIYAASATRTPEITTRYRYDAHGNVRALDHAIPALRGAPARVEYDYDLISGNVRELRYNPGEADGLAQRYRYDADDRLTHAYARFGPAASTAARPGDLVDFDRHARYRYYAHGPLARLELGDDAIQGLGGRSLRNHLMAIKAYY